MNVASIAVIAVAVLTLPAGALAGTVDPTLDSIQSNVFTPRCAMGSCHGAAMQANLNLSAGQSYANIVDVPSVEFPVWDRVEPFDPDQSFLLCKLEACPSMVGQQMPLIGGPLDQTELDAIRLWILIGAPEGGPVAVEAATWGQVKATYR